VPTLLLLDHGQKNCAKRGRAPVAGAAPIGWDQAAVGRHGEGRTVMTLRVYRSTRGGDPPGAMRRTAARNVCGSAHRGSNLRL